MHGHLPVAGSSAALPGDGEGKALLITKYLTVKAAAHPVITVSPSRDMAARSVIQVQVGREWLALAAGGLRRVVTVGDALVPWSGGDYARRYQAAHCESGCGKIRCYPGRTCGDRECIAGLTPQG